MTDIDAAGAFYLGRVLDGDGGKTAEPLLYPSADLVTHAVCVGMTGSGKTGLCVALLEEAALEGVPAIVIDPKGDLTNLLLAFPGLSAEEFRPYVAPEQAGGDLDAAAAAQAQAWKEGLAEWGEDGERIRRYKEAADFAIYTPGSDAGLPLSVLGSLDGPGPDADAETTGDAVESAATGLLSLVGIDADPVRSREHILLSTLIGRAWAAGGTIPLESLVGAVQTPGIEKIGVLDLESFYPAKDRFELAMALNAIVAAPSFALWRTGEPLDAGRLLRTAAGRPRVSVISIAHLSDSERMFVVSRLLTSVVGWMRAQPGTQSLRAIVYMDEVFGFLPPTAAPPTKKPLLTLLKQARAAGVGIVLATQNPVDLDYKALGNAGTWLVGRLQAQQDKARLLDGLESASSAPGGMDRAAIDAAISGLPKRSFLLHDVHAPAPRILQSRWALSYLAGPLTREQISALMAGRRADPAPAASAAPAAVPAAGTAVSDAAPAGSGPVADAPPPAAPAAAPPAAAPASGAPVLAPGVEAVYLPVRSVAPAGATLRYEPRFLGAAAVAISSSKLGIAETVADMRLVPFSGAVVDLDWSAGVAVDVPLSDLGREPDAAAAAFAPLPAVAARAKAAAGWSREYAQELYRTVRVERFQTDGGKLVSAAGETEDAFRARVVAAVSGAGAGAEAKVRAAYAKKLQTLDERIRNAEQAVEKEKSQASGARMQAVISLGTSIFGGLLGRRGVSSSTISRAGTVLRGAGRAVDQSKDVGRAREDVQALQAERDALAAELEARAAEAGSASAPDPAITAVQVGPTKAGIDVRIATLAFAPVWLVGGEATPAWG